MSFNALFQSSSFPAPSEKVDHSKFILIPEEILWITHPPHSKQVLDKSLTTQISVMWLMLSKGSDILLDSFRLVPISPPNQCQYKSLSFHQIVFYLPSPE